MIRRLQNRRLQQLNSRHTSNVDSEIPTHLSRREFSYGEWPGFLPIHRPEPNLNLMHYGYVPFVEPPPPYAFLKLNADQNPPPIISTGSGCMEQFLPQPPPPSNEAPPSYEESITNNLTLMDYGSNLSYFVCLPEQTNRNRSHLPASQANQPFSLANQFLFDSYPGRPIATYRSNHNDNTNCSYIMNNFPLRNNVAFSHNFNQRGQDSLRKELAPSRTSINNFLLNNNKSMPMSTSALSNSLGKEQYTLNKHKGLSSNTSYGQPSIQQDYGLSENNANTNGRLILQ